MKFSATLHVLPGAVARSSSDDSAIRYVLPVLWMTSFSIMGPIIYGVGNTYATAMLQQVVTNLQCKYFPAKRCHVVSDDDMGVAVTV